MNASPTLRQLLREAQQTLERSGHPSSAPRLEAELLLAHCLGKDRSYLYAHAEEPGASDVVEAFQALIGRRATGEPVAYLTGEQEFWSLPLKVNPAVLIPRPETERLVELVLERLPNDRASRVADIGTGSGAISLAITRERPLAEVHAVDLSEAALGVARNNARRLSVDTIAFHLGHWCEPLMESLGAFDAVVSNPPYVKSGDPHLETGDLRFEPQLALTPGDDALVAFREISSGAEALLRPGGWLLFEHGFDQGKAVQALLAERGWSAVHTESDLAGLERVTLAQKKETA